MTWMRSRWSVTVLYISYIYPPYTLFYKLASPFNQKLYVSTLHQWHGHVLWAPCFECLLGSLYSQDAGRDRCDLRRLLLDFLHHTSPTVSLLAVFVAVIWQAEEHLQVAQRTKSRSCSFISVQISITMKTGIGHYKWFNGHKSLLGTGTAQSRPDTNIALYLTASSVAAVDGTGGNAAQCFSPPRILSHHRTRTKCLPAASWRPAADGLIQVKC